MADEVKELRDLVGRLLKMLARPVTGATKSETVSHSKGKTTPAAVTVAPAVAQFEDAEYQRQLTQIQRDFDCMNATAGDPEELNRRIGRSWSV